MEQLPNGYMLCRVVGVSFDGRQDLVRKLRLGQELVLLKHSGNGYDTYGIGIFNPADCKSPLGFIGRDIKHHKVFESVRTGLGMAARVHRINRGRGRHGPWGFMVAIADPAVTHVAGFSACRAGTSVDPASNDMVCQIVIKQRS
jgi:hypothetical protein